MQEEPQKREENKALQEKKGPPINTKGTGNRVKCWELERKVREARGVELDSSELPVNLTRVSGE